MRRLYVLLPDVTSCKRVVEELEQVGIPESHLHVVASLAYRLDGLPKATVWQKTELAHGIEWGIALGGVAGLVGGMLAVLFPPSGLITGQIFVEPVVNDEAFLILTIAAVAGASLGGIISAILGSHEHNHDLDRFRGDIVRGRILLMADVPRGQVEDIQALIRKHHVGANFELTLSHKKVATA